MYKITINYGCMMQESWHNGYKDKGYKWNYYENELKSDSITRIGTIED